METAVSVIIPVYNCEKTVGRCINSVLNQTLADIEVIAVNDGSDDSTLKVLKGINDDRLKIISHLNYGQGYARNNGMSVANGKYIAFIDADDTIEECMLEKMYEKAEKENADMDWKMLKELYPELRAYSPVVEKAQVKGAPMYRLIIRQENGGLMDLCNKLRADKTDCLLR